MEITPGVIGTIFTVSLLASLTAQSRGADPLYLAHNQARPVFDALGERLPAVAEWPSWIAARDRDTRARVAEGDETSIVHWLLFGTSFTDKPRVTSRELDTKDITDVVAARLGDFERALAQPGSSERLAFARKVLGGPSVRPRLLQMLDRVMKEGETHARLAEEARALGDPSLEFAERSRMYRARGLSADTSLRVNFAIEEALRGLTPVITRGSDPKNPIQRVAIIGPGLDFSDKQEGYDFYPPQTIQPFALQDSLIRLGLAGPDAIEVTTFDLSPRVIAHVESAVTLARAGSPVHHPLTARRRHTVDAPLPRVPGSVSVTQSEDQCR